MTEEIGIDNIYTHVLKNIYKKEEIRAHISDLYNSIKMARGVRQDDEPSASYSWLLCNTFLKKLIWITLVYIR